jgi:hypothetical protein
MKTKHLFERHRNYSLLTHKARALGSEPAVAGPVEHSRALVCVCRHICNSVPIAGVRQECAEGVCEVFHRMALSLVHCYASHCVAHPASSAHAPELVRVAHRWMRV